MAEAEKKLVLIDGMPLLFRAYFAFLRNPRLTSSGVNTSAIFGYTTTLLQILERESPSHIGVAFDVKGPTFRHKEFKEYKAHREAIPEDVASAIQPAKDITAAMNIPILSLEGFEADDIVGTVADRAAAEGFTVYMVTPDKDFAQLVDERVYVMKPGRAGEAPEIMGVPEVLEKWGIERVDQVIDILGLAGDASDNIPGIPGVGEKTAQKLIAEFGSVEGLLENSGKLKGKQKEKVEQNVESALLSKRLATIVRDVPLDVSLKDLALSPVDDTKLKALFEEYEFSALAKRIFGDSGGAAVQGDLDFSTEDGDADAESRYDTIDTVKHDYGCVTTAKEKKKLLARLKKEKPVCFDIETTGLDVKVDRIVGIAFSFKPHTGTYLPFPADAKDYDALIAEVKPIFEDESREWIGHNIKFDVGVLHWNGVHVRGKLFDTMLAHFLIEPEMRHGMDYLANVYLSYAPVPISALIGEKGEEQKSIADADLKEVADYAAEDADVTLRLYGLFREKLKESNSEKVFYEVEAPLIPVLVGMESHGVCVDRKTLADYSAELAVDIAALQKRIYATAGSEFNLNSPKQLGEVLFDVMKLDEKPKKTKTGQYQTNEQILSRLAVRHEIAQSILDYRMMTKLKSTYVDALPNAVFKKSGRIHTTYNQAVAVTGRMQSHGPNLQNIPIRTARGREVRKAFVAKGKGVVLLSADYSQVELRVMAELSGDKAMLEAFVNEVDIHTVTAAKVNDVDVDDVTDDMRRTAKMVNFGIIYGISAFGLAQRLDVSRFEAAEIIEGYFAEYPGVRKYMDATIEFAREHGYVETITGRRRYLRDITSDNNTTRTAAERNAINSPIQGSAADMIKLAMVQIDRELSSGDYETKMIMQVHDELVFELFEKERDEVLPIVENGMKNAMPMKVPIVVEMGEGKNWLDAH